MNTIELDQWINKLIDTDRLWKFYKSIEFRHIKEEVLREQHYECQECKKKGKITKANTVHHVQFVRKHPELALSKYYTYKGKISGDIYMTKSRIYPNYYYKYICENNLITGKIEISKNPLFHKNIFVTVLIIVFSEILIFPYLLGLLFFQIRYSNIGLKLDKIMSDRNLKKLHITDNEFDNIYKLNVSDLDFSFLIEYLPSNLQKKYHNISNLSYKNISLAGYFLLLNAIYDYYGVYYFPDFKEGKPFDLALDFKFNISHSKNVVVLATSYDEVGIDIEYKRKLSDEVKKRLFENEKINDKSATRKWTKLESAIKLEGSSILKYENINFKKYHINTIFQDDYAISRAKFKKIRKAI